MSAYRIPGYPIDADGAVKPIRHNDGSMVISRGNLDDENTAPVLLVLRRSEAKRGRAWNTPDPEQEAFAAHVLALLNANPFKADGQ